jgi:metal-responsive CopG/Arc/MetJ family transcriptional regulator
METIQVVLDEKLLKAADNAAKREKVNRSALIRQALEEHLKRLHLRDLERRDRRGYQTKPQRKEEYLPWEDAAAWPED